MSEEFEVFIRSIATGSIIVMFSISSALADPQLLRT